MENLTREELLEELKKKEKENEYLKLQLENYHDKSLDLLQATLVKDLKDQNISPKTDTPLCHAEIARYSRQLILPELGPQGQRKLGAASALIVGCGGLGCPAAIYMAAAGVGRIGLLDYDVVEVSNLHRQISHTERRVGISKAVSLAFAVKELNGHVEVIPYNIALTSDTAIQVISKYDLVLDCTDNVATRYLLNDACVMTNKPLISGAALRYEGQLTVYHFEGGPCYRCIHPKPPLPETVTNCSDGGVLGVIPGVIGCMQALEAIKIISRLGSSLSQRLLLFDGMQGSFRTVKLRGNRSSCEVCGENPSILKLIDYEQFCGAAATDKDKNMTLLEKDERLTVEEFKTILEAKSPHVLIDVRLPVELEICALPNCINIPLKQLSSEKNIAVIEEHLHGLDTKAIYCVCRRGNDSQLAVQQLQSVFTQQEYQIKDIIGGLTAWAHKIDPTFPVY
nr:adenylyltransferase and sulfurtransferase MOCS3-like [Procambarus clarkii]XP_045585449.1 adenylyltransferase and sulfurtransferase MOCS3-like [Procambarus clarkii]XP_045585450.1 adenylyltransferase and sulfurtransferase MOCS3-like [Procambarus clarkii]